MPESTTSPQGLSPLNVQTLGMMVVARVCATVAFDLWGEAMSPAPGFANLSPHMGWRRACWAAWAC